MDRALIIGASGGIGSAVAQYLLARGAAVTSLSRSADGLDLTDPEAVERVLGAVDGTFDLILVATGGLEIGAARPEKSLTAIEAQAMSDQFALNAIGPALVLRHAQRLLPRRAPGVIAVLSARVGSIGDNRLGGWISYRAAKAALNQIVRTASVELARTHPLTCCISLHPGTVATPLTARYAARHPTVSADQAASNLLRVIGGLGPDQTGRFFDWAGAEIPW